MKQNKRAFYTYLLGFSTNHGAVQRWTLTAAYRAEARKNMLEFLSLTSDQIHPDLNPTRIKRDQKDVLAVKETIISLFINPFEEMELISLSSGIIPTEKVTADLLDAELIGEGELVKFQKERLSDQNVNFYDTIKKLKLGTFTQLTAKSVKIKKSGKVAQFTAQSNIFGKIALIQQFRPLDLKEVFCYPLGPVPWALSTTSGELVKTNKSALLHHLEKGSTDTQIVRKPFASIIDGMALVRKIKPAGHTYSSFADQVLKVAVTSSVGAERIDIVFDVYRKNSIKNAERGNRESGKLQVKRVIGSQPIKQFVSFLSSNQNKMELIRFLVSRWQTNNPYETPIYVGSDESCHLLGGGPIQDLTCSQEEADTRILLHAKNISQSFRRVVIHTPDTDVFMIALGVSGDVDVDLYIKTGVQNKTRLINLSEVKELLNINNNSLGDINLTCKALLGLHGFTGCDTVSAFSGKGKVKPLKLMLKNQEFVNFFGAFGEEPDINDDRFAVCQKFVCELYGHKDSNTNNVRYKMYASKQGHLDPKAIPPCEDSLRLHTKRAAYQVHIWRKALEGHPNIPSPVGHGWDQNEEGDFVISWNTVNPAPDEILELMFCSCTKKCVAGLCPCVDNNLSCTDACVKQNCKNFREIDSDSVEESDEEDSSDDEY